MRTPAPVEAGGGDAMRPRSGPPAGGHPLADPAFRTTVVDAGDARVEQWVAPELGNCSYLVVDRGSATAAVVDPLRDVDGYLDTAAERGWRIGASVDTHVHNDFVSGGPDLRAAIGSTFAVPADSAIVGADRELSGGDEISVGSLRLRAIHTPGHTPEHLSYLLLDRNGGQLALFSGGALMVGTMARPDLLGPSRVYELSRRGRESLQHSLLALPDELCVLPTHGGGSFCGAASSTDRATTIGRERRANPLATAPDFAHFLALHAKQGRYPAYYARMAAINRAGAPRQRGAAFSRLTVEAFDAAAAGGAALVDCRPYADFDAAHVPGSLSVPVDGAFSAWVGWVVDIDTPVVLIAASAAAADDATRQLVRIGFTRVAGWLDQRDWVAAGRDTRSVASRTIGDVAERILDGDHLTVLDVRDDREWAAGHLPGAVHALAPDIAGIAGSLDRTAPIAVHCATGFRAALGVSLLLQLGFGNVWHVSDGVDSWTALGHPLVTAA